jgi:signal transduction histidine kinase
MSAANPRSLRTRLITRLIFLQALVLALFSLATVYAFVGFNSTGTRVLDPRDADVIIASVVRAADGTLAIDETSELRDLRRQAPGLWFLVQDENGQSVGEGTVPEPFRPMAADLSRFGRSYISESSTPGAVAAALSVSESSVGKIHAIVGGGRRVGFAYAYFIAASRFLLPLVLLLSVVTMIAIPWIIRRELRGISAAAAQADRIDINRQGARLPDEGLPREVLPLVKAMNAALARLDEGYARQKRFLAYAAHELKTPIAILQTRIETTASGDDRDRLLMDVARLGNLVEQLLDTQRLELGAEARTTVDLVRVAEQVAGDLAPLVISSGYELSFQKEIPAFMVSGDWSSLEHAISNLLQNAVAHGGGRGTILMRVERDGTLEVADEGSGIPPEEREKIFEPFYRVRPRDRGTGLGLSLVDDIVRRHDGRVTVGATPDGGALFRLSLPGV